MIEWVTMRCAVVRRNKYVDTHSSNLASEVVVVVVVAQ